MSSGMASAPSGNVATRPRETRAAARRGESGSYKIMAVETLAAHGKNRSPGATVRESIE